MSVGSAIEGSNNSQIEFGSIAVVPTVSASAVLTRSTVFVTPTGSDTTLQSTTTGLSGSSDSAQTIPTPQDASNASPSPTSSSATSLTGFSSSILSTSPPANSTETSSGAAPNGLGQTSKTHKVPVGAIAGGVVAGLVVLAVIVYLLLRARRREANEVDPFPQNDDREGGALSEKKPIPPVDLRVERPEPFILSEKQQALEMAPANRQVATAKSAHSLTQSSSSQNPASVIAPSRPSDIAPRATTPLASSSSFAAPNIAPDEATQPPDSQSHPRDPNVIEQLLALRQQVQALESRVQLSTSSPWSPSDSLPPPEYTSNTTDISNSRA